MKDYYKEVFYNISSPQQVLDYIRDDETHPYSLMRVKSSESPQIKGYVVAEVSIQPDDLILFPSFNKGFDALCEAVDSFREAELEMNDPLNTRTAFN